MQYLVRRAKGSFYARSYTRLMWGNVRIVFINSQEGRTSSLASPKVSEAMDNQLQRGISGRHAELGPCSGEMLKCKYKGTPLGFTAKASRGFSDVDLMYIQNF
jgi:hypothetical protein